MAVGSGVGVGVGAEVGAGVIGGSVGPGVGSGVFKAQTPPTGCATGRESMAGIQRKTGDA